MSESKNDIKTVLVISCFFNEQDTSRPYLVYEYFSRRFKTYVLYSGFSHWQKEYVQYQNTDYIPVRTLPYSKDLSLRRIFSHIHFSVNIKRTIERISPDLIYVAAPPNSSAYLAVKEAKRRGIKSIVDIVALWPEALPVPSLIKCIQSEPIKKSRKRLCKLSCLFKKNGIPCYYQHKVTSFSG